MKEKNRTPDRWRISTCLVDSVETDEEISEQLELIEAAKKLDKARKMAEQGYFIIERTKKKPIFIFPNEEVELIYNKLIALYGQEKIDNLIIRKYGYREVSSAVNA